jgi:GH25 family lysozyme M1 (1,4-beta-N-acetylmuramidase)
MKRAWGIDVSHWDVQAKGGPIIDYHPLIKLHPSFVFVKVTDGVSIARHHEEHIAATREFGLVLGLYHWFWPTLKVESQADAFSKKIDQFNPPIIVVDNEQVFISSELSKKAKAGEIPMSEAIIPPEQISNKGRDFMRLLRQRFPDKLLLNYTADWFVKSFSPPMGQWINEFPLWLAAYPFEKETRTVGSWEEFEMLREGLTEGMIQNRMPLNADQWLFWQWGADKLLLPAPYPQGFHVDLNVYNGTPEEFHARFGGQPGSIMEAVEEPVEDVILEEEELPVPVGERYICNTGVLNIRTLPMVAEGTETGKFLFKGDEITVFEILGAWGRIDQIESLWVNVNHLVKVELA